jgi:hypothetical protein
MAHVTHPHVTCLSTQASRHSRPSPWRLQLVRAAQAGGRGQGPGRVCRPQRAGPVHWGRHHRRCATTYVIPHVIPHLVSQFYWGCWFVCNHFHCLGHGTAPGLAPPQVRGSACAEQQHVELPAYPGLGTLFGLMDVQCSVILFEALRCSRWLVLCTISISPLHQYVCLRIVAGNPFLSRCHRRMSLLLSWWTQMHWRCEQQASCE